MHPYVQMDNKDDNLLTDKMNFHKMFSSYIEITHWSYWDLDGKTITIIT